MPYFNMATLRYRLASLFILICNLKLARGQLLLVSSHLTELDTSRIAHIQGDPDVYIPQLHSGDNATLSFGYFFTDDNKVIYGALASDFHMENTYFFHEQLDGKLHEGSITQTSLPRIFGGTSTQVTDLAVDWINKNLYYTDSLLGIGIFSYTKKLYTIVSEKLNAYHGIDVDPIEGLLFYTDSVNGSIVRCSLSGADAVSVVTDQGHPTSIVTDVKTKSLFWIDVTLGQIITSNYDGSSKQILWRNAAIENEAYIGIAVYNNYIFLALRKDTELNVRNKLTGDEETHLQIFSTTNPVGVQNGIAMASESTQPNETSGCSTQNGGCQDVCTAGSNTTTVQCMCQFGYKLGADGKSCIWEPLLSDFILVTDQDANRIYQIDTRTEEVHALPSTTSDNAAPQGISYDPVNSTVYWVDHGLGQIRTLNLLTRTEETFFSLGGTSQTLTLDTSDRYVYYSDTASKKISRISMRTKEDSTLLLLTRTEKPFQMRLDTAKGHIYWTDWGSPAKIERADLTNGDNRQVIVSVTNIFRPTSLELDISANHMYWCDISLGRLERANLDGTQRTVIKSRLHNSGILGLTMDEEYLYLSTFNQISKIRKSDFSMSTLGPRYFWGLFGIHSSTLKSAPHGKGTKTNQGSLANIAKGLNIIVGITIALVIGSSDF